MRRKRLHKHKWWSSSLPQHHLYPRQPPPLSTAHPTLIALKSLRKAMGLLGKLWQGTRSNLPYRSKKEESYVGFQTGRSQRLQSKRRHQVSKEFLISIEVF
jgi:hypothetical protein